ncbi:hypothetical protein Bca4012_050898 [Brassica carinata]
MLHCWSFASDLFVIVLDLECRYVQRRLRILTFLESVYALMMLVCVRSTSMIFSSGVICGCVLIRYARP